MDIHDAGDAEAPTNVTSAFPSLSVVRSGPTTARTSGGPSALLRTAWLAREAPMATRTILQELPNSPAQRCNNLWVGKKKRQKVKRKKKSVLSDYLQWKTSGFTQLLIQMGGVGTTSEPELVFRITVI